MDRYKEFFQGKKITVMGLGLLGRGVGDAAFLAECGAELIVTDLKSEDELRDSFDRLKDLSNITFRFGEHRYEDFEERDLILVAAGVPMDSPYLAHAREAGVRLTQSAALFVELSKIPVIGVTGTRGKSTVAHMIHHVLEFVTGEEVILGGNIRGVSNLQLLKEVKEDSLAVMELDSWQLQGFGWAEISPQIAVFTNFMEDHMNYYKRDGMTPEEAMTQYFADKANIFRYQEESGVFLTTPEVFKRAQEFAKGREVTLGQEVVLVDSSVLPEDAHLALPGEHNRLNAALAVKALEATGLTEDEIYEGLASFSGVPGRLEYLTEVNGVKIYNDNNATTPQATAAGIEALADEERKNIVLIAGGADKGLDFTLLVDPIKKHCKQVILIPGTGTDKLTTKLKEESGNTPIDWNVVTDIAEAVEVATQVSESGDIILFSPGFASFGMFKNEYDRNDAFVQVVEEMQS